MTSSLAAVFEGQPGRLKLQQIPLPSLGDNEVLVRVLGCTLCGSDLHSLDGRRSVPIPTVLGHEIVGEIEDFGRLAPRRDFTGQLLQVGDRVTWAIVAHCGTCFFCERGLPQKCLLGIKYGHEAMRPGYELRGGLAEHCLLARGTSIFKLGTDIPLDVACPTSCATATIAAALEAIGGDLHGRNVCVFGAGMLGLTACAMLRSHGAAIVLCIDPLEARCQLATSFGATHIATPNDIAGNSNSSHQASNGPITCRFQEIRDLVPHGFDAALELSGSPVAIEAALPLMRLGGTLILVGSVFPTAPVSVVPEQVVRRQLTLRGIHNYAPHHLQRAVEFLSLHHAAFPFATLVSQWLPLAAVPEQLALGNLKNAIRVGVTLT